MVGYLHRALVDERGIGKLTIVLLVALAALAAVMLVPQLGFIVTFLRNIGLNMAAAAFW